MRTLDLRSDDARATVLPDAGGRLHQLEVLVAGRWTPLLASPDDPADHLREPMAGGSYPMVPWPNRVSGARFTFDGRMHALDANLGEHAIHGLGAFQPWSVDAADERSCRISTELSRWPFGGRAVQSFELADGALRQRIEVHSTGERFPAGAGWHPFFRRDSGAGDLRLCLDADELYETDAMIPTGRLVPVAGGTDLRGCPPARDLDLDTCYRDVRWPARLRWDNLELGIDASPNAAHAVIFSPSHAVCVEPQTCAIDAFNLDAAGHAGTGVEIVEPRRPLVAETVWSWRVR
jgi:aldose 1-epimerase